MIQKEFAKRAAQILSADSSVIGLTVGGSWLTGEVDKFSDIDLTLVSKYKIADDKSKMVDFANRLGHLLSGFTGEHVGEPRLLICLYDAPLLHVDIKFLTLEELRDRVETPIILLDKDNQLQTILNETESNFPYPDYQWIEDRFWTWVHYAVLKIGRGEYLEAFDFFSFLRSVVFGPLLHIMNGGLPKGVRKVESKLPKKDLSRLLSTLPNYSRASLFETLQNSISLYRQIRSELFPGGILLNSEAENKVMQHLDEIQKER